MTKKTQRPPAARPNETEQSSPSAPSADAALAQPPPSSTQPVQIMTPMIRDAMRFTPIELTPDEQAIVARAKDAGAQLLTVIASLEPSARDPMALPWHLHNAWRKVEEALMWVEKHVSRP